jgi:hypothetical protein
MVVIILILIVGLSLIIFIPMSIRNMLIDWDNFVEFGKLCWRSRVNLENIYLVFVFCLFIYKLFYIYAIKYLYRILNF